MFLVQIYSPSKAYRIQNQFQEYNFRSFKLLSMSFLEG